MKYDQEQREKLRHLNSRVDVKLDQIRAMIGPDLYGAGPGETDRLVEARLGALSQNDRIAVQIKAAIAHAELSTLLAEMNTHLDMLASEMRHTSAYQRAASAYGQKHG